MILLAIFALVVFAMAAVIGVKNPTSSRWKYIDPVYYPVASFGVILLFLLNTGQRKELELLQQQGRTQAERDKLVSSMPKVDVGPNTRLLDTSIGMFSAEQQLAGMCTPVVLAKLKKGLVRRLPS